MNKEKYIDPFLKKRLIKYDEWISNEQISHSSKVVPVLESFNPKQWVLPTEQVIEILRKAKSVAIQSSISSSEQFSAAFIFPSSPPRTLILLAVNNLLFGLISVVEKNRVYRIVKAVSGY
jgi:hypothetical protein